MKVKEEQIARGGWPARRIEATLTVEITDRQLQALLAAVELGALEVPREAGADDLSRELKVANSPAQRRLRKGLYAVGREFADGIEASEVDVRPRGGA